MVLKITGLDKNAGLVLLSTLFKYCYILLIKTGCITLLLQYYYYICYILRKGSLSKDIKNEKQIKFYGNRCRVV